ncbi:MAG: AAA family ATPase, partial [Bacteroidales bacterium]|nr:AAA family ATPase [Bacteroidales bacterium]
MRKYPIGIQNFESLRRDGYAYVDKTDVVWRLAQAGRYYFLSRPRRFGKSLLLSTIEAYFEGKKDLFEGLAIGRLEKDWKQYPILHLDLNASQYGCKEDLEIILDYHLRNWEKIYGRDPQTLTLSGRFTDVIRSACQQTGMPVVILVDEYDKPLALNLDNEPLQDEFRSMLKAFYGVMKSADRYIKLGFLTGVTKFSKVSVFSDLNNIRDISMLPDFITCCGMTEQEIRDNFESGVEELAAYNNMTNDECYAMLRRRYDGYHFRQNSVGLYNPYSLLNTLASRVFDDYWFATGTPTLLVNLLRNAA